MKRDVTKVINKICRICPELKEPLEEAFAYCAPELVWTKLTATVNKNVKIDPNDPRSVAVYAALMGCSKHKMRKRMIEEFTT